MAWTTSGTTHCEWSWIVVRACSVGAQVVDDPPSVNHVTVEPWAARKLTELAAAANAAFHRAWWETVRFLACVNVEDLRPVCKVVQYDAGSPLWSTAKDDDAGGGLYWTTLTSGDLRVTVQWRACRIANGCHRVRIHDVDRPA